MSFIKSLLESSPTDASNMIGAELNARALHIVSEVTKMADFVLYTRLTDASQPNRNQDQQDS